MNRKLLNGLLLLSVATSGVATFTSCKDTEDGLRNEVLVGQKTLGDQVAAIRNITDSDFRENLAKWLDDAIKDASDGNFENLRALVLEVSYLQGQVDYLEAWCQALEAKDADLQGQIDEIVDVILADLTSRVEALENWQTSVNNDLADLLAKTTANANAIEALQENMKLYQGQLDELRSDIADLVAANQEILDRLANNELRLDNLTQELQDLMRQFNDDMSALYSFLASKFAQFITSIPIHQTFNPIFGTINLPIGLQSNMVAGYFFNTDHNVIFPATSSTENEYWTNNPAASNPKTAANINMILPVQERFQVTGSEVGQPQVADGDNMGQIYLSINPRNIDYSGLEVQLVNSQDEPILTQSKLNVFADDQTVLSFGVNGGNFGSTKANEGSALYQLPVRVEPNWADINQIAFDIENKGELASALKNAVVNHEISDFAHLGKLIYDNMKDFLPAYAVKVSWKDPEIDSNGNVSNNNTNAVYSNFNIAAAVYRPLSFRTGFGYGTNRELPIFSPISEYAQKIIDKIRNSVNFELSSFNLNKVSIDFSNVGIEFTAFDITIDLTGAPVVNEDGDQIGKLGDVEIHITNDGLGGYTYEGDASELLESIKNGMQGSFDIAQERLQASLDDLVDQINDQLSDLQGKIDSKLNDVLNKIENALSGKLRYADDLVNLYNQLAKRINTLLKDPNHYLQAFMAYSAGDGLHHLSNDITFPTQFVQGSGDCIRLFATSYNAELIVPAFKKYVAVTGVYYPYGIPYDGFDLKALNEAAGVNKILDGRQQIVALDVTNQTYFQRGFVYEVYYTALDYRGFTSTSKYYFTIK